VPRLDVDAQSTQLVYTQIQHIHHHHHHHTITDSNNYLIVSRCRRTLRGEGHSAAGWGIGGSVIVADCGVHSPLIRAIGSPYLRCATCVIASQYATSSCKPLLVRVSL